jgi:hypothetical protein
LLELPWRFGWRFDKWPTCALGDISAESCTQCGGFPPSGTNRAIKDDSGAYPLRRNITKLHERYSQSVERDFCLAIWDLHATRTSLPGNPLRLR